MLTFQLEEYNQEEQRFAPVFRERLEELYASDDASDSVPPLHKHFSTPSNTGLALNVYLNKKNPLSLPRWCRTNTADEWLHEQFGSRAAGWRTKLEIVDPDPPPTLQSILEHWTSSSSFGTTSKRETFTSSLISEPYDLLEILLRLTKGDRSAPTLGHVPLATAIRSDSPYASHQTHVSLAILAMYRLTTDYAAKAGEKSEVVTEKIGDIIKSLPSGMITKSLDGMFKEWDAKSRNKDKEGK
jgi:20S proteasome subunit alpha 6